MLPEELEQKAEATKAKHAGKRCLRVCQGTGCMSSGADKIHKAVEGELKTQGCDGGFEVKRVGCFGLCSLGPMVSLDEHTLMKQVTVDDAPALVSAVKQDKVPEKLDCPTNVPFFQRQQKIVLEHAGVVDPEDVDDYIAVGGYAALVKALTEYTPQQVVEQVTISGLRGRGGAGFPTGLKWSTVSKAVSADGQKYVICNGDEGDPGAFMDRSVMEGDPHRVIEGMAIAGYAVRANQGYVYVRAEYPLAVKRLKLAIKQAEKNGLLGKNICGTTFSFNVDVRLGAGAFVCGEETALIASIEGRRGQPRPRPPFPAESGLWGRPTLINNVETFANIAPIVRNGGAWFAAIGTEKSKGTKVFALAGKVNNIGLIEVPMGIKLRDIIYEIGGGIPGGHKCKAVQTGGPSGGCIPEAYLDMPVDYESLAKVGSIMGSGGMIVMDDTSDMVDVARFFMEFCKDESCGKCVPCRVGTAQMYDLLTKLIDGNGTGDDLRLLQDLCDMVKFTSLCGLGQTAPNPVLSTLKYFGHEYEALVRKGEAKRDAEVAYASNGHSNGHTHRVSLPVAEVKS
jgi:bidirectional [NiFe] hydrogenase diaphorase subunit